MACSKFLLNFSLEVTDVEIGKKINTIKSESNFLWKIRFSFDPHGRNIYFMLSVQSGKGSKQMSPDLLFCLELDIHKPTGMLTP